MITSTLDAQCNDPVRCDACDLREPAASTKINLWVIRGRATLHAV